MYILGISAFYHDSAAVIIHDGKTIAAAQEERFSRIKHDPNFPIKSINFCLNQAKIKLTQLEAVVFYEKPLIKFERLLENYLLNAPLGFNSFRTAIPIWLQDKLFIKRSIRKTLASLSGCNENQLPTLYFDQHHRAHAASAYYPSSFDNAAIICLDGVGEWATTSIWYGEGNQLKPIKEIHFPHSLGLLYSAFTYYCGFRVNSGEYKLMGLAPHGNPVYTDLILKNLITSREDGSFKLSMKYFNYHRGLTMTSRHFHDLFSGEPRKPETELTQKHKDLAASIQKVIEQQIIAIANFAGSVIDSKELCLAGGVALNCVANSELKQKTAFKKIWVQPAAGDAGGALGAALSFWHGYLKKSKHSCSQDQMSGCLLGPEFNSDQIETELKAVGAIYNSIESGNLYSETAKLLANQFVVGWFQGRMEFGPRALGARSILADPTNPDMQSIINQKIKFREDFRPFAPAVLEQDKSKYFNLEHESPYMLFTAPVLSASGPRDGDKKTELTIPAVTHVDGSARVQTVNRDTNPRFYKLLSEFKKLTGGSVLLNTSFNIRGEPIVCTPTDAYKCFMQSGLDYLIIGNFIVDKKNQLAA